VHKTVKKHGGGHLVVNWRSSLNTTRNPVPSPYSLSWILLAAKVSKTPAAWIQKLGTFQVLASYCQAELPLVGPQGAKRLVNLKQEPSKQPGFRGQRSTRGVGGGELEV